VQIFPKIPLVILSLFNQLGLEPNFLQIQEPDEAIRRSAVHFGFPNDEVALITFSEK
jgi:hypothetical protein